AGLLVAAAGRFIWYRHRHHGTVVPWDLSPILTREGPPMDPTEVSPELYATVFENDRVRVLKYRDQPGDCTKPHTHPDSVMVTLSSFRRRVSAGGRSVDVEIGAGQVRWVGAQE